MARLSLTISVMPAQGAQSECQWDDVTKLIKLLRDAADLAYLRRAAETVGVADLLEELLSQSAN